MNIDLNWKEKCWHCDGTGICNYRPRDKEKIDTCYMGCRKVNKYETFKSGPNKGQLKPAIQVDGPCNHCNGYKFTLTDFGMSLKEYVEHHWDDLLKTRVQDMIDGF